MARHRDFRTFDRSEHDFDDDDDYHGYGQSYEDDQYGASPTTREQYTYNYGGRNVISDLFPVDKNYEIDEGDFEENNVQEEPPGAASTNDQKKIHASNYGHSDTSASTTSIPITISSCKKTQDTNDPKPRRQSRANRRAKGIGDSSAPTTPNKSEEVPNLDRSNSSANDPFGLGFEEEDVCTNLKPNKNERSLSPCLGASAIPNELNRRQSSPVIRTGMGSGDSHLTPSSSRAGRTTRVAQLAANASPQPAVGGRNSSSRPGSGTHSRGGQSPSGNPGDVAKRREAQSAKVKTAYEKRKSSKPILNLVVIGHVDAGKSTLMGHVLHMIDATCETRSCRVTNDSRSNASDDERAIPYAWNLDETDTERDRGVTIDVAQTCFETEHRRVVLLDAPGHKDFIPNMICGAAQADVALLVVNATRGEFETGFDAGGQTREHAMLVRSLGVQQLVVAVNKMDTVDWTKERYDSVMKKSRPFLKNVRFNAVQFIPVSGLHGINLIPQKWRDVASMKVPELPAALSSWYDGPSLLESIDQLTVPERQIEKPFRFCVSDFFRIPNSNGVTVSGMVVSGGVLNGTRVMCKPMGFTATIKSVSVIAAGSGTCDGAFAGDLATLHLTGAAVDMSLLSSGNVICDTDAPILATNRIEARILLLTKEASIPRGAAMMFHLQNINESAIILRLLRIVDRATGEAKTRKPRVLNNSCCADVEIRLDKPICMELYKDLRELGRFTLRRDGKSIASGTVTKLYREDGVTFE